ncbi:MAG: type II toxin-antitoxin system VapC family toxin [Candidatus Eremiobacterota bacterium]
MKRNIIFDACAIIAFVNGEDGADFVENLLVDENNMGFVHAVNLCEVFYEYLRVSGESQAQSVIDDITGTGITVCEDMDTLFWQDIARYKAKGRISLADCFCIALAGRLKGEIITSDYHEFKKIANSGRVTVRFIR